MRTAARKRTAQDNTYESSAELWAAAKTKRAENKALGIVRGPMSAQANGARGEELVWNELKALPGFTKEKCWKSDANNNATVDFEYTDTTGAVGKLWPVAGDTRGKLCLIEVKATKSTRKEPMLVTPNQWNRAWEAHKSEDEIFILVRVLGVGTGCHQIFPLPDPVALVGRKELDLMHKVSFKGYGC